MQSLLLKLKAPMQSWAYESRYKTRNAGDEPTKSGVLGLLAAAEGRRRSESIEDLAALEFGVRIDQAGKLKHDFQTAIDWRKGPPAAITERYYVSDAVFVAAVSGPGVLIERLSHAVSSPQYPLYLGRRSCPVNSDLVIGLRDGNVEKALRQEPWHASNWYRKLKGRSVLLPLFRDAHDDEVGDLKRDVPFSFSSENRQYGWREVFECRPVLIENELGRVVSDPFLEAVMNA